MTSQQHQLNNFLVHVFNDILRLEYASVRKSCKNLSVSELHVLEAVQKCTKEDDAGMADIAGVLGVSAGTATVAVKTLEQKGFLVRTRGAKDKRRVTVCVTEKATPVLQAHEAFHEQMVTRAAQHLSPAELNALTAALEKLHLYFKEM